MKLQLPAIALVVISAFAPLIAFGQQRYNVTDLGELGGDFTGAYGVNDAGEVTGFSLTADRVIHAFLYKHGLMEDLGSLLDSSGESVGNSINNRGWVTGDSSGGAFIFGRGEVRDLGAASSATAINDRGEVTGTVSPAGQPGASHAFLYDHGVMTDLGTLPGGRFSAGTAINSSGEIVGYADNAAGETSAFLYRHGTLLPLNTPGGPESAGTSVGINDKGDVVGTYDATISPFGTPFQTTEAFIRYRNGQVSALGFPMYGVQSFANAINNQDVVVGAAVLLYPEGDQHAVIYANGVMTDLNDLIDPGLGINLIEATAISDNGNIVANGDPNGGCCSWYHAYLLTPIYPSGPK